MVSKPNDENTFNVEMDDIEAPVVQPRANNTDVLPDDYEKHHILIINGKVKRISKSSAYILDMLTKTD